VPEEIVAVIVLELAEALNQLEPDDLETIPAIAAVWNSGNNFGTNCSAAADPAEAAQVR
jgi:hypothetical protein